MLKNWAAGFSLLRRLGPSLLQVLKPYALQLQHGQARQEKADREGTARHTRLIADEAGSWNDLHSRYTVDRIDHGKLNSAGTGVYTHGAEEFFSRMRRAEIGHHHHVAGPYLARYAQEAAWRQDHRRADNGHQVQGVMGLAMACRPSVDWCGYWQRAQ